MRLHAPSRTVAAGAFALLLAALPARALSPKKAAALAQFKKAQQVRASLEQMRPADRAPRDYQRAIAAFRRVYFITPASGRADAGIQNAAALLAEEGQVLGDRKASLAAVKEYQFLIEQYPGTRFKAQAMFEIGQIYQHDLHQRAQARQAYEDFLAVHPRHPLSPRARAALAELDTAAIETSQSATPPPAAPLAEKRANPAPAPAVLAQNLPAELPPPQANQGPAGTEEESHSPRALITGIKHWSTPDYTRVVISLSQEVQYEAGRVPSPARVFFDLRGARLAAGLRDRSLAVDDGYVKKIRMAQFQPGMTRIVLEVAPHSESSAFLLPNPERLIVDIRGPASTTLPAAASAGAAPKAGSAGPLLARKPPARISEPQPAPGAAAARKPGTAGKETSEASTQLARSNLEKPNLEKPNREKPSVEKSSLEQTRAEKPSGEGLGLEKAVGPNSSSAKSSDRELNAVNASVTRLSDDDPVTSPPASDERKPAALAAASRAGSARKHQSKASAQEDAALAITGREAAPVADGERTLIRALGLKIGKIVVDAGHGGHDTGTVGPHGLMEKDLVLDVALRLGRLLQNRMGAEVAYTRTDDTFIPLETRTAIANREQADLFISVHANSSRDPGARGIETYYLNFTTDPNALEVAARENADSGQSIHELQDLVKKIALKEKVEESREFAADVDHSLRIGLSNRGNHMRDRGVKQAPFVVLIGANMPSILAEISFLSNPHDERLLRQPQYRQKIAQALYHGVLAYVRGLSGLKLASAATH